MSQVSLRFFINRSITSTMATPAAAAKLAATLAHRGCVVVPASVSPSTLAAWRGLALAALRDLQSRAAAKSPGGVMGLGKAHGFREVVQKDPARWDVNFDHLITGDPIHAVFSGQGAGAAARRDSGAGTVGAELMGAMAAHIRTHIHHLLTLAFAGQYAQNAQGLVVAHPGCGPQRWHCDVSPLFGAEEAVGAAEAAGAVVAPGRGGSMRLVPTPAYFFTVFVPLYDPRVRHACVCLVEVVSCALARCLEWLVVPRHRTLAGQTMMHTNEPKATYLGAPLHQPTMFPPPTCTLARALIL